MNMKLRQNAEDRLRKGTAPPTRAWTTGTQALTLLHGLASAPETASDALKLLHELQVHQVELDLQHEQVEQDRLQHAQDLRRYAQLFELAPFAYLTLDPEGRVMDVNRSATDWLAARTGDTSTCVGRRIEELVAPESRSAFRALLAELGTDETGETDEAGKAGNGRPSCTVQFNSPGMSAQVVLTGTRGEGQVMLSFMPTEPGPAR